MRRHFIGAWRAGDSLLVHSIASRSDRTCTGTTSAAAELRPRDGDAIPPTPPPSQECVRRRIAPRSRIRDQVPRAKKLFPSSSTLLPLRHRAGRTIGVRNTRSFSKPLGIGYDREEPSSGILGHSVVTATTDWRQSER